MLHGRLIVIADGTANEDGAKLQFGVAASAVCCWYSPLLFGEDCTSYGEIDGSFNMFV